MYLFMVGFQWQSCRIVGQLRVNRNSWKTQGFHSLGILTIGVWSQTLWETVSNLKSCLYTLNDNLSWTWKNYDWKEVDIFGKNISFGYYTGSQLKDMFNVLCPFQYHSNNIIPNNISVLLIIIKWLVFVTNITSARADCLIVGHYFPVMPMFRWWAYKKKAKCHVLSNLLTSNVCSLWENIKPQPWHIDLVITRSI